jgi:hypothetical protein
MLVCAGPDLQRQNYNGERPLDETPPSPHAFALAFREALEGFRQVDGGRFDHEYFWAPYTLYGLG